ncbi:interleukin-15 [Cebidichthys violaceus]|uniref:interleukin-15 n=1 Tax=Cebidichthys violaceus TaxID=271503 RepID=UPI0035CB4AA4
MKMGCFMGIPFWILLSGCLLTQSVPIEEFRVLNELKLITCPPDTTLYAPTNVEPQCVTTALDCVFRELGGRAKKECENSEEDINDVLEILDDRIKTRLSKGHALTNSTECACERWPEKSLSDFVTAVNRLFQIENSLSISQETEPSLV